MQSGSLVNIIIWTKNIFAVWKWRNYR